MSAFPDRSARAILPELDFMGVRQIHFNEPGVFRQVDARRSTLRWQVIYSKFGIARAEQHRLAEASYLSGREKNADPSLPRPEFINAAASEEGRVIGTGLLASGPTW
jgi:hypothetical protein